MGLGQQPHGDPQSMVTAPCLLLGTDQRALTLKAGTPQPSRLCLWSWAGCCCPAGRPAVGTAGAPPPNTTSLGPGSFGGGGATLWGQRDVYGPQLPPLRPEQRVQTLRCTIWTLQQVCCAVSAWRGEVMRGPRGSPFHSSPSSWNTEGGQGRERRVGGMAQEQEGVVGCPGLHQGGQVLGRACGTHFGSGCAHSPP